ncbi:MAG TPA: LON peptidase substrate-binding domain-containing protein [Kofleriaceae bacterium]|nr:LON peptidase substrate-binding domain-containing protein [Kofleriaceae bacterium]
MTREATENAIADPEALATLPIFPLADCVLLPGGLLPLHVFEPRYRDLTRDCLAGRRLIGMARLRPGHDSDYDSRPPIYDRCGVGRIMASEELPDGRFVLLLRGVARVEIARELPADRSYRLVEAHRLIDAHCDANAARGHHKLLVTLCDQLAGVIEQGGSQLRDLVRGCESPGACADAVAAALVADPDARQELLESCDPIDRLERTIGHVGQLLCELAPAAGGAVN